MKCSLPYVTLSEAEQIVCHFGKMNRLELYTDEKKISISAQRSIERAIQKRKRGVPLQHILGVAPFYGREFMVSPDVLIPRPETERLVEEALIILRSAHAPYSVLDLGTGSGCIAASLTLEGPPCRMTALDASKKALGIARKNFKCFELEKKIRLVEGRFEHNDLKFDLIVSNPPYIPTGDLSSLPREVQNEPRLALDGGGDGLLLIESILEWAPRHLKPGGWLLLEIGGGQAGRLRPRWSRDARYAGLRFEKDLNGIDRILIARKHG